MDNSGFRPITLEDREIITHYTLNGHTNICDLAFSNLYGWAMRYQTSWAILEGSLVIGFKPGHLKHPAYLVPLCDSPDTFIPMLKALKAMATQGGYPLVLMGVTPACREHLDDFCPEGFQYFSDEGARDYLYLREKMVSLSGKSLQSKRNHINKFEKLYPSYSYEPITRDNIPECLSLLDLWLERNGDAEGRADERTMIARCMEAWEPLELVGGAIRVEGHIVAFSYGSPINQDTFGVHVEKADTSYEGAFTIINREFAKHIPEQYTYINREEDLGFEGLRKSKLSYKPAILLHKDTAILRHECKCYS